MRLPRASGILLHPTSLPSSFGIGDLGPGATAFVDYLAEAGQRWWQVLPLNPTGFGNSPYQAYSSYAGNRLLLSPERLVDDGWLTADDWSDYPILAEDHVDFDAVTIAKDKLFKKAFDRFDSNQLGFHNFINDEAFWLDDYSLYMAIKEAHGGSCWFDWPAELIHREPEAMAYWREKLATEIRYAQFLQFSLARQWRSLREYCNARNVGLIGDVPIFVAHDSADVWSHQGLFELNDSGRPTVVAGVPPDYFAAEGQLWGNPLYRWDVMARDGYSWWIGRLKATTRLVDLVRLDHFRGFQAYWEVPATAPTAMEGRWAMGPGTTFFDSIREGLGGLPLIAEDLGMITDEVRFLRDRFELPGMRVLQFAFNSDPRTDIHLPHNFVNHCFVYTGTHDNDTTIGWFTGPRSDTTQNQDEVLKERAFTLRYLGSQGKEINWDMIRLALASAADTAIIPMQDILGLGREARMNVPGRAKGNWGWRMLPTQLDVSSRLRLAELTAVYGRWNGATPDAFRFPELI
ncbi:4-alpha-glucanotransferase [Isosphaeraceae bacterium EP7]